MVKDSEESDKINTLMNSSQNLQISHCRSEVLEPLRFGKLIVKL
jgi:hypothetical protein